MAAAERGRPTATGGSSSGVDAGDGGAAARASTRRCTTHWKRAPARVRRWERPTALHAVDGDLAGADAGEAHLLAEPAAHQRAGVHLGAADAEVGQRGGPGLRRATRTSGRRRRASAGRPAG